MEKEIKNVVMLQKKLGAKKHQNGCMEKLQSDKSKSNFFPK